MTASAEGMSGDELPGGPTAKREAQYPPEVSLSKEEYMEATSLMKHSADESKVKKKMTQTCEHRRSMVLDKQESSNILSHFPRFRDVRGLVTISNANCITNIQLS